MRTEYRLYLDDILRARIRQTVDRWIYGGEKSPDYVYDRMNRLVKMIAEPQRVPKDEEKPAEEAKRKEET